MDVRGIALESVCFLFRIQTPLVTYLDENGIISQNQLKFQFTSFLLVKAMVTTITESAMRQHQSDIDHALVIKLLILNRISRRFRICESVQRVMKPFRAPDRPKSARAALKYITEH